MPLGWLMPFVCAVILTGCVQSTPAVIRKVQDRPVQTLKASENSKPIQLHRVVIKLKRGEHLGALESGAICAPAGNLTWQGGRLEIRNEEFVDSLRSELEKYSFKTVGGGNLLFEDPSTWQSEILVAALVTELKSNLCAIGGFSGLAWKGEASIKVEWQIYSKLDRSVVHTVKVEGYGKLDKAVSGGDNEVVLRAFSQATRHLLADKTFREIVSRGGETVKHGGLYSNGETIDLSAKKAKPVGNVPAKWSNAVVTIFAGKGHGSGFVVSDNLILTNQHVVGSSNSIVVKFNNGMKVVGKVVASDSRRDVALVKVDADLPFYFRVAKELPSVGIEVYAIGSPLTDSLDSTVSRGIISGFREKDGFKLIQSDVSINRGSSGGPLVDKSGAVVGVTVAGIFAGGASQGLNFFIPIEDARQALISARLETTRSASPVVTVENKTDSNAKVFEKIIKSLKEADDDSVKLSFILLENSVINTDEAKVITKYEQIMEEMVTNSSFALAVSPSGRISTGRAWGRKSSGDADSIALKWCLQTDGISPIGNCAVVMRSGGWDRQGLIEVFESIPEEAAANWKESFVQAVRGRVNRLEKNAS